jgi:hypothetical protein
MRNKIEKEETNLVYMILLGLVYNAMEQNKFFFSAIYNSTIRNDHLIQSYSSIQMEKLKKLEKIEK